MSVTDPGTVRDWLLCGLACALALLSGCGQRGALYLPDRNARVVTRPAATSGPEGASSAPVATQPAGSAPN